MCKNGRHSMASNSDNLPKAIKGLILNNMIGLPEACLYTCNHEANPLQGI